MLFRVGSASYVGTGEVFLNLFTICKSWLMMLLLYMVPRNICQFVVFGTYPSCYLEGRFFFPLCVVNVALFKYFVLAYKFYAKVNN